MRNVVLKYHDALCSGQYRKYVISVFIFFCSVVFVVVAVSRNHYKLLRCGLPFLQVRQQRPSRAAVVQKLMKLRNACSFLIATGVGNLPRSSAVHLRQPPMEQRCDNFTFEMDRKFGVFRDRAPRPRLTTVGKRNWVTRGEICADRV